jgi:hypothetical protein
MSVALKALLAFQKRNSRSLKDKDLQDALFAKIQSLELSVDAIGPTPLRHKLSELLVQMRTEIWAFDQSKE